MRVRARDGGYFTGKLPVPLYERPGKLHGVGRGGGYSTLMRISPMAARVGCLGVLALWALVGTSIALWGGYENGDGGGKMALIGLIGVALFIVACMLDLLVAWLRRRRRVRSGE